MVLAILVGVLEDAISAFDWIWTCSSFVAESWFTLDAGYREFEKIEEGEPSCLVCCSILWRDSESDLCW